MNCDEVGTFRGEKCIDLMFEWIYKTRTSGNYNILLFAHNLGYDISFVFKCQKIEFSSVVQSSISMTKTASAQWIDGDRKLYINFKDSYALTTIPLRSFPEAFGITDIKKEVMPYSAYTIDNSFEEGEISLRECLNGINESDDHSEVNKKQFIFNCIELGFLFKVVGSSVICVSDLPFSIKFDYNKKGKVNSVRFIDNFGNQTGNIFPKLFVNHISYSEWYCKQDILVLEKGIIKHREALKDYFNLDLFFFISTPQIAESAAIKAGVFKDVYKIKGQSREFISKCIYGGRVMTNKNCGIHVGGGVVDVKIQDFDAVSLYPSAMCRNDMDIPTGIPLVKNNMHKFKVRDLEKYNSYYVKVNILNIPFKLDFPLLSTFVDNSRQYSNECTGIHYLSKPHLEDVVKHHSLKDEDYEIICGYFFVAGSNNTLKEWIGGENGLFNERLKYKKTNQPLQNLIKLIMNSFYGKTIQNPIGDSVSFFYDIEKRDTYICKHYSTILEVINVFDSNQEFRYSKIKKSKPSFGHSTFCHVGSNILSVSKRIMNEVMCLAQRKNITVLYQDTDSMHIEENKIPILEKEFKKMYNRELIGGGLGQFHSDFNSSDPLSKILYSKEFIALGKKCYLDVLKCQDIKTGEPSPDQYHIRMKGVPHVSIKELCKDENLDVEDLYKNLLYTSRSKHLRRSEDGNKLGYYFDLSAGSRANFKFSKGGNISSKRLGEDLRFLSFDNSTVLTTVKNNGLVSGYEFINYYN